MKSLTTLLARQEPPFKATQKVNTSLRWENGELLYCSRASPPPLSKRHKKKRARVQFALFPLWESSSASFSSDLSTSRKLLEQENGAPPLILLTLSISARLCAMNSTDLSSIVHMQCIMYCLYARHRSAFKQEEKARLTQCTCSHVLGKLSVSLRQPVTQRSTKEREFLLENFHSPGQRAAISTQCLSSLIFACPYFVRFRCRAVSATQRFPLVAGHNTGPLLLVPCDGTTHRPSAAGAFHAPKQNYRQ